MAATQVGLSYPKVSVCERVSAWLEGLPLLSPLVVFFLIASYVPTSCASAVAHPGHPGGLGFSPTRPEACHRCLRTEIQKRPVCSTARSGACLPVPVHPLPSSLVLCTALCVAAPSCSVVPAASLQRPRALWRPLLHSPCPALPFLPQRLLCEWHTHPVQPGPTKTCWSTSPTVSALPSLCTLRVL